MNPLEATLIALVVLALVVIAFFAVFRRKGQFELKSKLGTLKAKGENSPPPTDLAGGVKIKGADAGGKLTVVSSGPGGVDLENVKAKRDISATHTPGDPPPKT